MPYVIDYNEVFQVAISDYARAVLQKPRNVWIGHPHTNEPCRPTEYKSVDHHGNIIPIIGFDGSRVVRPVHAVETTFILPSLIEHCLIQELENTIKLKWLKGMDGQLLNDEEHNIVNHHKRMKIDLHGIIAGSRDEHMKKIWAMGVKYGVFNDSDKSMKQMLCGQERNGRLVRNTLGSVLQSTYAKSRIEPEYLYVVDALFSTKNLDIRNCIAHGKSVTYDYLDIRYAAVMVQLIYDIVNGIVVS